MLLVISSIICFLGLIIVTVLHLQHKPDVVVSPLRASPASPLISVIVPARNEERNIRRCIGCLLAQDYPNFEVLVLDDRSSDATPAILKELAARDSRLQVQHGSDLPPGWAGKTHALHQAAHSARGEWLCFVDADTFAAPPALASVLQAARLQKADMFSIFTLQELCSFWEKVILPLVFTGLSIGFAPRKVNDPSNPAAIANGQFILVKQEVYQAVGGHAAIRASIVEDRDLAALVKGAGYRLVVADGQALASTRMYTSLPEMWEGWTKNIFLGLRDKPGLLLLGVFGAFVSLFAALLLPLWLLGGFSWWIGGGGTQAALIAAEAALLWGCLVFWRSRVCRAMGISGWYAFTVPLGAGIFAAMMVVSAWKVLSGRGVTWKGRKYASRG
jgi:chlorobactene glucosyltransferase